MENIITLGFLVILQIVLGFDNLLYISLESQRAPIADQSRVRKTGILIAVALRIALLFAIMKLIEHLKEPFATLDIPEYFHMELNVHAVIVLMGGLFILKTAIKEIWHMMIFHDEDHLIGDRPALSAGKAIFLIVVMNVIFSVDSILSAMALTHVIWVMATAIIIGGILMLWTADHVSSFLAKNRL
jgi:predicted tellurium resistance membrane protein TerC